MQEDQNCQIDADATKRWAKLPDPSSIHDFARCRETEQNTPRFMSTKRPRQRWLDARPLGRQPKTAVRRLLEESFLNEPLQNPSALIRMQLKQPGRLLDRGRKPAHLEELAAHARFHVRPRRCGATPITQCGNRKRLWRDVERAGTATRRFRRALRHHSAVLRAR